MISGDSSLLYGYGQYVIVTLKDGNTVKFDYDSFEIPWIAPQVKDELTCDVTDFNPAEVEEILILTEGENFCDRRDDWLFDVYLREKDPIRGFIEVTETMVRGKLFGSSEQKSISFEEINKVSYY